MPTPSQPNRFRTLLDRLVGRIEWRAPPWLQWSCGHLVRGADALAMRVRRYPRIAAVFATGAILVLAAGYVLWRWYDAQPKPQLVEYSVVAPAVTCYDCEPPLVPRPLVVNFAAPAAALERVDKDLPDAQKLIELSPALAGRWHWNGDKSLSFQPAQDWPIGQRFGVRLARRGLLSPRIRLDRYDFEFSSAAFTARIAGTEFHQDPSIARDKKAIATVSFSHPVDPQTFERRVSLTMFKRITDAKEEKIGPTAFTVVYDKLRLNAYVHSAELAVPDKSGRLNIRIDSGVHPARGGNETEQALEANVQVPGLYSLAVEQMDLQIARDEREEPRQVLVISMNHSVAEKEIPTKLQAWLLPVENPDPRRRGDYPPGRPFPWSNASVTRDLLERSPKLEPKQIPGEREHSELHSFRHDADPGRFIYVKLEQGLKSFGGYALGDSVERVLRVPEYPREVRIAQQGSLLALTGSKTLTVMTRDMPGLRVEVGRLLPRQLQHLVTQTGGTFSRPEFHNWSFDSANITERFESILTLPALQPGAPHYETLALGDYLKSDAADRRGMFMLRVQGWDPKHKRPLGGGADMPWNASQQDDNSDTRLVVITDLGLIAKANVDKSRDVFVQSIGSGEPAAGVEVEVIGSNGLAVLSQTTGSDGHVRFPDLSGFRREQQPVLYLAQRSGDSAFLPIEERDRGLDFSRFDIGGVRNASSTAALSAYLFSDRGLYRPGETIRIGAIVRSQDWRKALQGVPLRLEIVDPQGVTVRSGAFVPGAAGFGEISHTTRDTAPAGNYTVSISIVRSRYNQDLIGALQVQVRDFLPDRLRMSTHFSTESAAGWVSPEELSAGIALQNLFGTPAQERRVTARMTLTPSFPSFRGFPDYKFFDPQLAQEGFTEMLAPAKTDAQGHAVLALNLQRFSRATYRLHLAAEGFEADGGRGVSAEAAQLVSNMPYLVGYKADGDLAYVSRGARRTVDLIAIDSRAARTAVTGLRLARLETRYVSTLLRQRNGSFKYESRRKDIPLEETALDIPARGLPLALTTEAPGAFAYLVRDAAGQTLSRIEYRVAGTANLTRTLEKNAELQIALAKTDYASGEEIEMQIQAPYTGAGLITIERDRVYSWRWFRTNTTSSTQRITVPAGLEGNAYVTVSFVRDLNSAEIYTSPLSYGVQPFSVALDARRNDVHIEAPAMVKPGATLRLHYSTDKPSRLVVFAVDEGILQVARYHTPNPLGHFFQKRALEVSTAQILDLILPEFKAELAGAAPGGDAEGALGRHLNPFKRKGDKPVVFWSGIVPADRAPRELSYDVPDYFNGALRVMAVAVADDTIGVHEGRTTVRGDFVLSPNAPTTVTPGDEFELSVGVANNLAGSGKDAKIEVRLKTDPGLQLLTEPRQVLNIGEGREAAARFKVRALDRLGPSVLEFSAGSGAAAMQRSVSLSIRPAAPYMTWLSAGTFRDNREVPVARRLYPEHRALQAGVSRLPLQFAHGFVSYLGNYPYSCTEQLVSQAMPALLLGARPEFGEVQRYNGADLPGLMAELRVRQNDAGAYRLWPGGNEIDEFVAIYAQHFLVEAGEHGAFVPADVLDKGNQYLRTLAARDGNNLNEERNSAYALYLLTRQGQLLSAETSKLRKRLTERYANDWRRDMSAAWFAATLQLLRQTADAGNAIAGVRFNSANTSADLYYDSMTRDALLLYIQSRHFPERLEKLPPEFMPTLAEHITRGEYHSLSSGATLLALDAYVKAARADGTPRLSIVELRRAKDAAGNSEHSLPLPAGLFPRIEFSAGAAALRFASEGDLDAFYLVDESGFDRAPPKEAITKGFEILRDFTDPQNKALTQIGVGQQLDVHLKFRILGNDPVDNVALVDLLPGGFELVIPPQNIAQNVYQAATDPNSEPSYESAYQGWHCQICVGRQPGTLRYADIREDRVVFYANVTRDTQEILYRIKATNIGRYTVPPAYGEAMYDRGKIARSVAGQISVVAP